MSNEPENKIIHRDLKTSGDEPAVLIVETVAEIEDKDPDDLSTAYRRLGHVLDDIFSNPPSPEAQLQVTFSYEGYRITVEQNGRAQFVKTT